MNDAHKLRNHISLQLLPEFLKNSPLLMGVSAFAKVYVTSIFLSLDPNLSWLIAPLVAVSVYGLNDLSDWDEDAVNQPYRDRLVGSYRWIFWIFVIGLYIIALGLAVLSESLLAIALTGLPGLSSTVYTASWLPFSNNPRIKETFLLNTILVAGTWAVVMTYLPLVLASTSVSAIASVSVASFWFLRSIVTIETCNIPDIVGDRHHGISTVPTKYGIRTTQCLLYAIDIISIGLTIIIGWVSTPTVPIVVVVPALVYSMICTYLLRRRRSQQAICVASDIHVPLMASLLFMVSLLY